MDRIKAAVRIVIAVIFYILAITTLVNLVLISTRPETISVVNAMIGQGVIIIALAAIATIQIRKGLKQWRESPGSDNS